jgi:hypothetical protein
VLLEEFYVTQPEKENPDLMKLERSIPYTEKPAILN